MNMYKERMCIVLTLCLSILPFVTSAQTLMSVLKDNQQTAAFARALESNGLDQRLKGNGPFTVFAPSGEAMNEFSGSINDGSSRVRAILMNHIMTGLATERSIQAMTKATSLGGLTLNIDKNGDQIYINRARLLQSNIRAANGVIHVVDHVLR